MHHERRISPRYPVTVGLRWRAQGKWVRRPERATIVDLSLRGARIRARTNDAIKVGSFVDIRVGRGRGIVEVRRIEGSHEPSIAYFGVQFVELDSRLRDLVVDRLERRSEDSVGCGSTARGVESSRSLTGS